MEKQCVKSEFQWNFEWENILGNCGAFINSKLTTKENGCHFLPFSRGCVKNTWGFHGAWRWDGSSAGMHSMPKCMSKYSKGCFKIPIDDIYFFIIVSEMFAFFQSRRFWLTNLNPVTCIKAAHYLCIVSNQHTHTQTHSCTSVATLLYHLIYILFKFNFYNLRMVICVTRSPPHSFAHSHTVRGTSSTYRKCLAF